MSRDGQSHGVPAAPARMGQGVEGPQTGMTGDPITTITVGGEMGAGGLQEPHAGDTGLTYHWKGGTPALMGGFEDLDPGCFQLIHELPRAAGLSLNWPSQIPQLPVPGGEAQTQPHTPAPCLVGCR